MRTALIAALAALGLSGCSLMIDPDGVAPPEKKLYIGACIDSAGGHALCGGRTSGGALSATASSAHAVERAVVNAGSVADVAGTNHQIKQGIFSP